MSKCEIHVCNLNFLTYQQFLLTILDIEDHYEITINKLMWAYLNESSTEVREPQKVSSKLEVSHIFEKHL